VITVARRPARDQTTVAYKQSPTERVASQSGVLVLWGEPGVGKSARLADAIAYAGAAYAYVLVLRDRGNVFRRRPQ
jgi:replication-associated recombination protein RarA